MEEIFSKQRIKTTTAANDTLLFEVPSKSSLEWAKSLGIKGGNRVPLDEDGKSWRLEKY